MGEEVTRVSTDVYNLEKLLASTLLGSLLLRSVMFVDECTVACPFWVDALGCFESLNSSSIVHPPFRARAGLWPPLSFLAW